MKTTIYQKFISKYAEIFTLVEMSEGEDFNRVDITPSNKVTAMSEEEFESLVNELLNSENEKASWSDGEDEFDEEDARAESHQKWDEINDSLDAQGL